MKSDTQVLLAHERASTLVDRISSRLRLLILKGELAPGTRLVELEIAAQTNSSQASAREALQRLERDGLVVRRGRTGTFVTDVNPEEMHEIFQIRSMVEQFAIRRTARSIRAEQITELEARVEQMRAAGRKGDAVGLVEHDMVFHRCICEWAEHPTLLQVWTLLYAQVERFLVLYDALHFADLTEVADSHLPILEALANGDPDLAARRIEAHVHYVMDGASHSAK